VKILLMVSALNGLSQRVLCAIERTGHDTAVHIAESGADMRHAVLSKQPDLILCPFLKAKVPQDVWQRWLTIIIHPGPVGDRGPSSLDWAITDAEPRWGVTALEAVNEMDAGPIWASRTFDLPDPPVRKSALYNSLVADAAMACVEEVLAKVEGGSFSPTPLDRAHRPVLSARLRPTMTQADRAVSWDEPSAHIVRRIRAADGSPGVRTELLGLPVYAYDPHVGPALEPAERVGKPGDVLCHHGGAVRVRTGDSSIWLGHLRAAPSSTGDPTIKLPATTVLGGRLDRHSCAGHRHTRAYREIHYRRGGDVGWLTFDFYNGAMSTRQCERLLATLRRAIAQPPRVLVVSGSTEVFSNGIHLNVIEAADDPPQEAWSNITAINAVCKQLLTAPMTVLTAFSGGAGAGGAMLGLCGDVVVARAGIILNPYYDIGLTGSELHTYTLPRRVGDRTASRLLTQHKPVDTTQALAAGLVDAVGPRDPEQFWLWLDDLTRHHATRKPQVPGWPPLDAIEARELAAMSHDMFDDRLGFAAARRAFVHKIPRARVLAAV
jgi:putative two-component system hydrogenase maturation factor HypX/HoxX